ncbi:hypothetical protein [Streptococcus ferus]|uniref:hypothetical protein n=1 Tax=Streptococcus ferus TaxID=1345 RepID=UPI0035A035F6
MQTKSSLLNWLIMVALGILGGLIIWPFDPLRVGTGLSFLVSLPIFAYVYGVICRHQEDRQKALKQYSEFLLVGNLIVLALHASVGLPLPSRSAGFWIDPIWTYDGGEILVCLSIYAVTTLLYGLFYLYVRRRQA